MSRESMETLNTLTLIGNTDERGEAWHYRQDLQGSESNHYSGFIPVEDVNRRLFNFEVEEKTIYLLDENGNPVAIPDRKAMVRNDSGSVLGLFKSGYTGHSYSEWLIDNVATILGDDLGISSAGLLKNGGMAWVEVSIPNSITAANGFEFRPNLLAYTSFDGSLATGYGRKIQAVVCDNTFDAARSEKGQEFKLRHTKYSALKIAEAREALAIVYTMAEDFANEVEMLSDWKVSDNQFETLLNELIPIPESKTGITVSTKKQDSVKALYFNDNRAATWNGTALGVIQAFNTWNHHESQVRKGTPRVIRNYENVIKGKFAEADNAVLKALAEITRHDPVITNV